MTNIRVIAEIGWNFLGDIDLAKEMISEAAQAGAHFAKFQTWSVSRLKPGPWDTDGRREIYEKAELSEKQHKELIKHCNEEGIEFLSSVFSLKDAGLLVRLGVKKVKIPSFESRNRDLIEYCNDQFDEIFMSTGTSTIDEIKESLKDINTDKWTIMHCVSTYPCSPDQANIVKMINLKDIFENVGYSDHVMGVETAKAAIGFGASVIEKHFTTNRDLPGRDNKFAILPEELTDLMEYIWMRDSMLEYHGMGYQESEKESREIYTGRFNG